MNKTDIAKTVLQELASDNPWTAGKYLTEDFTFAGPVPEPIGKTEWLEFHTALKKAFPDWDFNVSDMKEKGNNVTCTVQVTGTHSGTLSIPGMPTVPATGKKVKLPQDHCELTYAGDKLSSLTSEGVSGGGILGIYSQLGVHVSKREMTEMR